MTTDGENWSADVSMSGHLAAGKRTADGSMVVVGYDPDGRVVFVSDGPNDRAPSFSSDGKTFVYVRHPSRAIVRCDGSPAKCKELHVDSMMPTSPRFSVDGRLIAYITQVGLPRVHVISADGGNDRDLGPARLECPPVWASSDRLWVYQGTASERRWAELDLQSGQPTGKQKSAPLGSAADQCSRDTDNWQSPFFSRARIVINEVSALSVLAERPR
jgi:hypothetical protein